MPLSSQWTRSQLRTAARTELQDSSAKWWTSAEINKYLEDWQVEVQDLGDFVWGTVTSVTNSSTFTVTALATDVGRLDKVYWNGVRLAPRTQQDLEVLYREWKQAATSLPSAVYQIDEESFVVWPPPTGTGTLEIDYTKAVSFNSSDTVPMQVPAWTKYSAINYVAWKAYERLGPNMDLNKALRYKKRFELQANEYKALYDSFFPYRYPQLRPSEKYEHRILGPYLNVQVIGATSSVSTNTYSVFAEYVPNGTMNGTNTAFTISVVPAEAMLFLNGIYQVSGVDYTLTGTSIVMTSPPFEGDIFKALVYTGVVGTSSYVTTPTVETVGGTRNGTNTSFTVTPGYDRIAVYLNGVLQVEGSDITFTGPGGLITYIGASIPDMDDTFIAYGWRIVQPYIQYAYAPISEIPSGAMNGTNTTYSLSITPTVMMLFMNGQMLAEDVGYTRVSNIITMQSGYIPFSGDSLYAFYW